MDKGRKPVPVTHNGITYGGKRYASVAAMARELEINWKNALVLVESEGRWL